METKQLYSNGTPFYPETNYEADNAAEKIQQAQEDIKEIQAGEDRDIDFSNYFS